MAEPQDAAAHRAAAGTVADETARLVEALGVWATSVSSTSGTAAAPRPVRRRRRTAAGTGASERGAAGPARGHGRRPPGRHRDAGRCRPGAGAAERDAVRRGPVRALRGQDGCGTGRLVPGVPHLPGHRAAAHGPPRDRGPARGPRRRRGRHVARGGRPRPDRRARAGRRRGRLRSGPARGRRRQEQVDPVRRVDRLRSRTSRSTTATAATKETSGDHDGRPGHRRHEDQRRGGRQRGKRDRPRAS